MTRTTVPTVLALALAVSLVWAPLPFASVTASGRVALQVVAALLLAMAAFAPADSMRFRSTSGLLVGLLGIATWGLLQSFAWPIGLVESIAPESASLQLATSELLGIQPTELPLSLTPDLSRQTALWLAALAALTLATTVVGRDRLSRRWLAGAVVGAALFESLYGARRWTAAADTIWGRTVAGNASRLRGTFVNSDHLALYLEIALAIVLAWIWWALHRTRQRSSVEGRIVLVAPPILTWLTLFAALAFTGSRAGLVAALTAVTVQAVLMVWRHGRWRYLSLGFAAAALGVGYVAAIGLQAGFGRWLATSPYEITWNVRRDVYRATIELWERFPLTGTGLGSFRDVFRLVQPDHVGGLWRHAHNDWLELLATTGIVGAVIALIALLLLVGRLIRVLGEGRRYEDRIGAAAALGAISAVAVHSALDFGLTMPANAWTLVVVCAAAAAAPADGVVERTARRGPFPAPVQPRRDD